MTVLAGHNLSKFYGPDEVFSGISVEVPPKSRIALVGPNGAGKTTLINLLIGADLPTEGTIQKARDARIAFLPQRPEMAGNHSIWEEQMKAFAGVREVEHEMNRWAELMADAAHHDEALVQYSHLQERFEQMGGYIYETKIRMVLTGVGFKEAEYETPLTQLSGGQKTRAMLCRLLLEEPDLLVLDEPTNHLDIYAVEWLESFLSDFPGAVLVISHDRYFIDHFATSIWELDFGMIETYRGNYTHYTRQRGERRERLQKEFDEQQEYIAKERDFIRKHMGSRWTAQAKGRLKKLNTMQKRGKIIDRGPRERLTMHLKMQESGRSGNQVVMTSHLTVGHNKVPLVKVPDLLVLRGETVAIIGPNGAGKSTLLKTLIDHLEPITGTVRLGANVKVGYFAQAHEGLDPNKTLLDEVFAVRMMPISEARNYLGAFMFSGDDVYRPVSSLSGGERGRVALAKLSLGGANLLLLDEPTNHLDIESQEILEEVLENFPGAIMLVSHDRYLIDRLATQIWDMRSGTLEVFSGTYQEYLTARNQKQAAAATNGSNGKGDTRKKSAANEKASGGLTDFERKKRVSALEKQIEDLEKKLVTINESLAKVSDVQKVRDLGHEYNATEAALSIAVEEWGSLAE